MTARKKEEPRFNILSGEALTNAELQTELNETKRKLASSTMKVGQLQAANAAMRKVLTDKAELLEAMAKELARGANHG